MAVIFENSFEGSGLESLWTQTVTSNAGNIINLDASLPWSNTLDLGSQCARIQRALDNCYILRALGSTLPISFVRSYIYVNASSIPTGNYQALLRAAQSGSSVWQIRLENVSGQHRLYFYYRTNSGFGSSTPVTVNLQQLYRVEVKYDRTNLSWEARVDGAVIGSGSLTNPDRSVNEIQIGMDIGNNDYVTDVYYDGVSVNDSEWPGAVSDLTSTMTCDISSAGSVSCTPTGYGNLTSSMSSPSSLSGILIGSGWETPAALAIDASITPGVPDVHECFGINRIVRRGKTVVAIATGERVWRSLDDGVTWSYCYTGSGGNAHGSLVINGDGDVIHFYRGMEYLDSGVERIYQRRFNINDTTINPSAELIYTFDETTTWGNKQTYSTQSITIMPSGRLVLMVHGTIGSAIEQMYVLTSDTFGNTWSSPINVDNVNNRIFPHIICGPDGVLHAGSTDLNGYGSATMQLKYYRSSDNGATWQTTTFSALNVMASYLLPCRNSVVYMFAQGTSGSITGLLFRKSTDNGTSWTDWALVDTTVGYADVTAAVDIDGYIYCNYRHSLTDSNGYRNKIAMSTNGGTSWTYPSYFDNGERTGTRTGINFQWFFGGGPFEWTWLQSTNSGTQWYTYYDKNLDVVLDQITVETISGTISSTSGLSGSITGLGSLSGSLSSLSDLSGLLDGINTSVYSITCTSTLVGGLTGLGSVSGVLSSTTNLGGIITGFGSISGLLISLGTLNGILNGVDSTTYEFNTSATLSGNLTGVCNISTSFQSQTTLIGELSEEIFYQLTLSSSASLSGNLTGFGNLSGLLSASSNFAITIQEESTPFYRTAIIRFVSRIIKIGGVHKMIETRYKDPDATLDFAIDWEDLRLRGDAIVSSEWIAESGITIVRSSFNAQQFTTVWLSGGSNRTDYIITNRITTAAGRIDDRSFKLRVINM